MAGSGFNLMESIFLNEDNQVLLKTTLSKRQVSKFNSLIKNIVIKNGSAYIILSHLHGVLLTRSKQRAEEIVKAYKNLLKVYLVSSDEINPDAKQDFIRPIGLIVLLDQLVTDNPRRANDYRASSALLSYIIAAHPQLALESAIQENKVASYKSAVLKKLKSRHQVCQLSGLSFSQDNSKHVHHIIAESVRPDLACDESNLIVLAESVHLEYHNWLKTFNGEVCRQTLKNFARRKKYSLDWDVKPSQIQDKHHTQQVKLASGQLSLF